MENENELGWVNLKKYKCALDPTLAYTAMYVPHRCCMNTHYVALLFT